MSVISPGHLRYEVLRLSYVVYLETMTNGLAHILDRVVALQLAAMDVSKTPWLHRRPGEERTRFHAGSELGLRERIDLLHHVILQERNALVPCVAVRRRWRWYVTVRILW
jgi:hypothetical protein